MPTRACSGSKRSGANRPAANPARTTRVEIEVVQDERSLWLQVADDGIGLPPALATGAERLKRRQFGS